MYPACLIRKDESSVECEAEEQGARRRDDTGYYLALPQTIETKIKHTETYDRVGHADEYETQ